MEQHNKRLSRPGRALQHAAKDTLQRRQAESGIAWNGSPSSSQLRPCESASLSWHGGTPPYALKGRWWPADDTYRDNTAREWIIATNLPYASYDWTATVPPNSTVWVDLFDTFGSYSSTLIFRVDYNASMDSSSTWCMSQYPDAAAASPGVQVDVPRQLRAAGPTTSSSVGAAAATLSTSTLQRNGAYPDSGSSSSVTSTAGEFRDMSGVIAGLSISVGVLSLAFIILLFLHIRLKRHLGRSATRQATIGNWSKRHFDSDGDDNDAKELDKPWETFSISKPKPASSSLSSRKERTPHTYSATSLLSSQSSTSRLSSFFENRSASRTGNNQNHHARDSRSIGSNPFEDYGERTSTTSRDTTISAPKRYSLAETAISDSNTIQSGSHMSTAMSEQASTVGGASVLSDEHYHRRKACTISPTTNSDNSGGRPFLEPGRPL